MDSQAIGSQSQELQHYFELVATRIDSFLNNEIQKWSLIDESISPPLVALTDFFHGGGKRLRPAFCYLGFKAESGSHLTEEIINAGCALELLHNFALVHDDFMDRADTRRGIPTVHKYLESYYSSRDYEGDIGHFANSVAILAGDFAFTYADKFTRELPARCIDVYDEMKVELFAGQQMDLDAVYKKSISKENISRIAQYKSGKYTIERPVQLGALLANEVADQDLWNAFGKPLGEAFQLRDDILGIFGDGAVTGKPVGDDIREGKYSLLIAEALDRATGLDLAILHGRGDPNLDPTDIAGIVSVIENCGARIAVEKRISDLFEESMMALGKFDFASENIDLAKYLARYVCWRES